jgi:hypothetical protein
LRVYQYESARYIASITKRTAEQLSEATRIHRRALGAITAYWEVTKSRRVVAQWEILGVDSITIIRIASPNTGTWVHRHAEQAAESQTTPSMLAKTRLSGFCKRVYAASGWYWPRRGSSSVAGMPKPQVFGTPVSTGLVRRYARCQRANNGRTQSRFGRFLNQRRSREGTCEVKQGSIVGGIVLAVVEGGEVRRMGTTSRSKAKTFRGVPCHHRLTLPFP